MNDIEYANAWDLSLLEVDLVFTSLKIDSAMLGND